MASRRRTLCLAASAPGPPPLEHGTMEEGWGEKDGRKPACTVDVYSPGNSVMCRQCHAQHTYSVAKATRLNPGAFAAFGGAWRGGSGPVPAKARAGEGGRALPSDINLGWRLRTRAPGAKRRTRSRGRRAVAAAWMVTAGGRCLADGRGPVMLWRGGGSPAAAASAAAAAAASAGGRGGRGHAAAAAAVAPKSPCNARFQLPGLPFCHARKNWD